MTTTTTLSTPQAAEHLGVPLTSMSRWVARWYGHPGTGRRHQVTAVDLMVARAWRHLWPSGHNEPPLAAVAAERAIRAHPLPWLLVCGNVAHTYATGAEAASRAWALRHRLATLLCVDDTGART